MYVYLEVHLLLLQKIPLQKLKFILSRKTRRAYTETRSILDNRITNERKELDDRITGVDVRLNQTDKNLNDRINETDKNLNNRINDEVGRLDKISQKIAEH